jgi:peptidoglycan/LPS O-acetylase OafA/YrhL
MHCIGDFLSHIYENHQTIKILLDHVQNGCFIVDIFFIISAFLAYKSYERNPNIPIAQLVKKRILRLLPYYWLSIILVYIFNFKFFDKNFHHFNDLIYQLCFLQSIGINVPGDMYNPYAWFVCVFLVVSVFMYLTFKIFNKEQILLLYFTLFFLCYVPISQNNISFASAHREIYFSLISGGILRCLADFSIGIIIAIFTNQKNQIPPQKQNLLQTTIYSIGEISLMYLLLSKLFYFHEENYTLLFINFIILFILLIQQKGILSTLFNKINIKFPDQYPLYIFQWFSLLFLYNIGFFHLGFVINHFWLAILITIIVCCLVSYSLKIFTDYVMNKFLHLKY